MLQKKKNSTEFHKQIQNDLNLMKQLITLCKKQDNSNLNGISQERRNIENDLVTCFQHSILKADVPLTLQYSYEGDLSNKLSTNNQSECNCSNDVDNTDKIKKNPTPLKNLSPSWHKYLGERKKFNENKFVENKARNLKQSDTSCICTYPDLKSFAKIRIGPKSCCKCPRTQKQKGKIASTLSYIKNASCHGLQQFGVASEKPAIEHAVKKDGKKAMGRVAKFKKSGRKMLGGKGDGGALQEGMQLGQTDGKASIDSAATKQKGLSSQIGKSGKDEPASTKGLSPQTVATVSKPITTTGNVNEKLPGEDKSGPIKSTAAPGAGQLQTPITPKKAETGDTKSAQPPISPGQKGEAEDVKSIAISPAPKGETADTKGSKAEAADTKPVQPPISPGPKAEAADTKPVQPPISPGQKGEAVDVKPVQQPISPGPKGETADTNPVQPPISPGKTADTKIGQSPASPGKGKPTDAISPGNGDNTATKISEPPMSSTKSDPANTKVPQSPGKDEIAGTKTGQPPISPTEATKVGQPPISPTKSDPTDTTGKQSPGKDQISDTKTGQPPISPAGDDTADTKVAVQSIKTNFGIPDTGKTTISPAAGTTVGKPISPAGDDTAHTIVGQLSITRNDEIPNTKTGEPQLPIKAKDETAVTELGTRIKGAIKSNEQKRYSKKRLISTRLHWVKERKAATIVGKPISRAGDDTADTTVGQPSITMKDKTPDTKSGEPQIPIIAKAETAITKLGTRIKGTIKSNEQKGYSNKRLISTRLHWVKETKLK